MTQRPRSVDANEPLRRVLPKITSTCHLSPVGAIHGLQFVLSPLPPPTVRFHHPLLEHRLLPLAARTPLRTIWHITWPHCSAKRSVNTCQVEAHQMEEDQVVEVHRVEPRQMEE